MTLFFDSTSEESSSFVSTLRLSLDSVLSTKSSHYNFDFYADHPLKKMDTPLQYDWLIEESSDFGRVSDASQSTVDSRGVWRESGDMGKLLAGRCGTEEDDDEDFEEGAVRSLPMFEGRRRNTQGN